jgi:hypothetical protein
MKGYKMKNIILLLLMIIASENYANSFDNQLKKCQDSSKINCFIKENGVLKEVYILDSIGTEDIFLTRYTELIKIYDKSHFYIKGQQICVDWHSVYTYDGSSISTNNELTCYRLVPNTIGFTLRNFIIENNEKKKIKQ